MFDTKYVYCAWNDKLEGEKVVVADTIRRLAAKVESYDKEELVKVKATENAEISLDFPFTAIDAPDCSYRFCYYDPYLPFKIARNNGSVIEIWSSVTKSWIEVENPTWDGRPQYYRVQPKYTKVLEVGDVVQVGSGEIEYMVVGRERDTDKYLLLTSDGPKWYKEDLLYKVEEE